MTGLKQMYDRLIAGFEMERLVIPAMGVKFYKHGEAIPEAVMENHPEGITLTSCQAAKQAGLGDAVCLTRDNIGCIAASISLGLVDAQQDTPLEGGRVYTDLMAGQAAGEAFSPPTPKDFTDGIVYACADAGRPEFGLFGPNDSGRFKDVATARDAVAGMTAIQPAVMRAVFLYAPEYDDLDLEPDVVVLSVRPVELTRIVQAWQFMTGKRVNSSMGGLRVVNSDLIARPYVTGEINISTYCLGARLIAKFEADRMGIGIPFQAFQTILQGMEASKTGFPFPMYPGASV